MEELDLKEIFTMLREGKLIIIALFLIGAIIGYVYNSKFTTPKYQTSTSIILSVENNENAVEQIDASELKLNKDLIDTYSQILKSEIVLEDVIKNLELGTSKAALSKSVTAKQEGESTVLRVTVTNTDPKLATAIANETADVFFEKLKSLYNITSARVLDTAKIPSKPYNINPVKYALIGGVIGVVLAMGIILIKQMLSENIKTESDIEKNLKIPVLTSVGKFDKNNNLVVHDRYSPNSEAFRILLSNIKYLNKRVFLVISNAPSEGKSWISANMATTYANSGKKTLLIDFDMRRGRQHTIFGLKNKIGLSDIIKEKDEYNYKKYIHESVIENLDVITKGATMVDYSKLLYSESIESLINMAREEYDFIIIDGTPFSLVADGAAVIKAIDSTLLVVKHDTTKIADAVKIKKRIEALGGEIFGAVLNAVPRIGKYYEHSYYGYNKNYMPVKKKSNVA